MVYMNFADSLLFSSLLIVVQVMIRLSVSVIEFSFHDIQAFNCHDTNTPLYQRRYRRGTEVGSSK